MIAWIERGNGFKGILAYVLGKEGASCIGGTVVGDNPATMAQAYRAACPPDKSKTRRPVWHCSLSLPSGEHLDEESWQKIAESYLEKMELGTRRAYTLVQHKDTDYDHVHIVASRVGLDGRIWHGQHEARKAAAATCELETEWNLTQVKVPWREDGRKRERSEKTTNKRRVASSRTAEESGKVRASRSNLRTTETDRKAAERSSGDNSRADSTAVSVGRADRDDERRTAEAPSSDSRSGKSHPGSESREVQESVETLDSCSFSSSISVAVSKSRRRRRRRSSQSVGDVGIRAAADRAERRLRRKAARAEKARQKREAEAAERAAAQEAEQRRQTAAQAAAAQEAEQRRQTAAQAAAAQEAEQRRQAAEKAAAEKAAAEKAREQRAAEAAAAQPKRPAEQTEAEKRRQQRRRRERDDQEMEL